MKDKRETATASAETRPTGVDLRSASLTHDGKHWLLGAPTGRRPPMRQPGAVPALANGIAIIEYLNALAPGEATLSQIASDLEISRSHCFSLLKTLVAADWLQFETNGKTYSMGSGILASVSSVLNSPSSEVIRTELENLVAEVHFPCVLAKPMADDSFVVIDKVNAQHHAMEVSFPIGYRFPQDSRAIVRAYLAWQSDARIREWLSKWTPTRYTDVSVVQVDEFLAEIEATRQRGYARSKGEVTGGLMALALPIFDKSGSVAYVFHCLSLLDLIESHEDEVAHAMLRCADAIHRRLMARVPASFSIGAR